MNDRATASDWFLFEIPVCALLRFIEKKTGQSFPVAPDAPGEAHKWHLALRQGLRTHLHINVGIPGVEQPEHPIEENACALHAALLLGHHSLKVILSGEWQVALEEGLISREQMRRNERALQQACPDLAG